MYQNYIFSPQFKKKKKFETQGKVFNKKNRGRIIYGLRMDFGPCDKGFRSQKTQNSESIWKKAQTKVGEGRKTLNPIATGPLSSSCSGKPIAVYIIYFSLSLSLYLKVSLSHQLTEKSERDE